MLKNPDVASVYTQTLKDYLDNNIIEEIDKDKGKEGNIWYLPHRMVVRDDNSTTKFRIVFDVSAKYKGIPSMSTWTQVQLCKATWWVYCLLSTLFDSGASRHHENVSTDWTKGKRS
ncbi:hypothetical protein T4B_1405 [Trichinella pseudospiralis]|uniref:Uncharacterized protein n=1 Tax=Trichinella pseudospiralis TaxID=6337 RepID=A0A0V1GCM1_TRIPS|nr:hypothetical protein T4B_1405 [Trichinella pseudospiralis]KRY97358.1 hypothetical protein T4C_3745 [Trichinella pseudospiralis]